MRTIHQHRYTTSLTQFHNRLEQRHYRQWRKNMIDDCEPRAACEGARKSIDKRGFIRQRPRHTRFNHHEVMSLGKMMLAISLERAAYWDVREESVSANYPVGTPPVHLPDGADQRMLANLASEILGRPVSFRASMLKADSIPPPIAATAKPVAGPSNVVNLGTLPANPEIADFMKFFPGARIE